MPGKVSAVFDLRRQLFRTVRLHDDFRENEKVPAADLLADLPDGSLILTDLGYFSFPFYDGLTTADQHWVARLRDKTSFHPGALLLGAGRAAGNGWSGWAPIGPTRRGTWSG